MWSFFKSKPVAPRTAPVLSHEAIEAGIFAVNGQGVHFAILYATMLGFQHDLLNSPEITVEFLKFAQSEPEFTEAGVDRAVRRLANDVDVMCKSGAIETYFFGPQGDRNQHLKPLLAAFIAAVAEFSAEQVFTAAEFDLPSFIIKTATERRSADMQAIFAKLDEKRPFLAPLLMRARAKGRNKYGDLDFTEFFDELVAFLRTYFNEDNLTFFYGHYPLLLCLSHVEPWLVETADALTVPSNGVDFEYWCAARIEEQGWNVRVSKASGDQGVDIEAMKDGTLVAIQCKRYAQPIGNKSVQQAYTGATHYSANKAVVIGTGGYTRAAVELAANTGVILIDAENIAAFTSLVSE